MKCLKTRSLKEIAFPFIAFDLFHNMHFMSCEFEYYIINLCIVWFNSCVRMCGSDRAYSVTHTQLSPFDIIHLKQSVMCLCYKYYCECMRAFISRVISTNCMYASTRDSVSCNLIPSNIKVTYM